MSLGRVSYLTSGTNEFIIYGFLVTINTFLTPTIPREVHTNSLRMICFLVEKVHQQWLHHAHSVYVLMVRQAATGGIREAMFYMA